MRCYGNLEVNVFVFESPRLLDKVPKRYLMLAETSEFERV